MSARKRWWFRAEAMTRDGKTYDVNGVAHGSTVATATSRATLMVIKMVRRQRIKDLKHPSSIVWCRVAIGGEGEPHAAIARSQDHARG